MSRQASRRRRRRNDEHVTAIAAVLGYAAVLVLVNVMPGWQALPVLTPAAEPAIALLNLSLIVLLVSRAVAFIEPSPRLRAGATYVVALINLALLAHLWSDMPFALGAEPEPWAAAIRMVLLALLAWDLVVGLRSAVGIVRGRRGPRLAESHA